MQAVLEFQGGPVVRKPTAAELRASAEQWFADAEIHAERACGALAARDTRTALTENFEATRKTRIGDSYLLEAEQLERGAAS